MSGCYSKKNASLEGVPVQGGARAPGRERAFMFPAVTADTLLLNYVFIVFFTFQFGNRKPVTL